MTGISTRKTPKTEFDFILKESFLSIYRDKAKGADLGYDVLLRIGDIDIYILHEITIVESNISDIPKSKLYDANQNIVNILMKRHLKLQKRFNDKRCRSGLSLNKDKMYFVGLATLIVAFDNQQYSIDHQFGSAYFQEHLVLDFDGDANLLQLFGTKSFLTILKILSTPTDVVSFLGFHRGHLVKQIDFQFETVLANAFLNSPNLLEPALVIENHLMDIDLMDRHDIRLIKALDSNHDEGKERIELIQRMRQYSDLWIKLLQSATARRMKTDKPIAKEVIQQLISESLFTRLKIMEDVFAYGQKTAEERQSGYVVYQHSYTHFGRQYMLVMYGSDSDSWFSRQAIAEEHRNLLINLNSQLQDPVMEDLILLGFDLTEARSNGDVDVQLDIYHLTASRMSEIEQYLNEQLLAMKTKN